MVYNKRGFTTIVIFFFIFFITMSVIFIGVAYFSLDKVNTLVEGIGDFNLGNISFQQSYQDTWGGGIQTLLNNLNTISLFLILGMIVVMLLLGYTFRDQPRLMILLDIGIIIIAFITSVYLAQSFESFINSDPELFSIYSNQLQKSSSFVLNLPYYIGIIGVLIMLANYIVLQKRPQNFIG